jgi:two-component system heavy metal sensor histidine kinase CusS
MPQPYRDILASNAEEFQRLARMVSDMLFLAKTERGVDLPHKERFSARQDALALLDFYEAVAEEKRIRLRVEGAGEIEGDRLMFRRAVSNLLSNALRYTPEAGDITIRITGTAQATTVAVENTWRRHRCQDPAPAVRPLLPRRCFQGPSGHRRIGLGPGHTRAIAEAHGGRVTASSGEGRTCFTLVFPHRVAKP